MRHRLAGRKLSAHGSHRKALERNIVTNLLRHERIITTLEKAKEFAPSAERLITLGKEKTLANLRHAVQFLGDRDIVRKLFDDIGLRYARLKPEESGGTGGYTRILKLGGCRFSKEGQSSRLGRWASNRLGDQGTRVILELVQRKKPAGESPKGEKAKAKVKEKTAKAKA